MMSLMHLGAVLKDWALPGTAWYSNVLFGTSGYAWVKVDAKQGEVGAPQAQMGAPQVQVGAPQVHMGTPQVHMGAPQVPVGAP